MSRTVKEIPCNQYDRAEAEVNRLLVKCGFNKHTRQFETAWVKYYAFKSRNYFKFEYDGKTVIISAWHRILNSDDRELKGKTPLKFISSQVRLLAKIEEIFLKYNTEEK